MNRRLLFIVNPIAGGRLRRPVPFPELIRNNLPAGTDAEIKIWEGPAHTPELENYIRHSGADVAIAAGGDGTINMVARSLEHTRTALGIIPLGSGNGLARHLGIPLLPEAAIRNAAYGTPVPMDAGRLNGHPFYCTSGLGFDALIGSLFATSKVRGFYTYFQITASQLMHYKPQEYILKMDSGKEFRSRAFLLTVANAGQFGNNAWIAPHAQPGDGQLDLCILKPFKPWEAPQLARRLFGRTLDKSHLYESIPFSRELTVIRPHAGPAHVDGEPLQLGTELHYQVLPHALRVVVPGE